MVHQTRCFLSDSRYDSRFPCRGKVEAGEVQSGNSPDSVLVNRLAIAVDGVRDFDPPEIASKACGLDHRPYAARRQLDRADRWTGKAWGDHLGRVILCWRRVQPGPPDVIVNKALDVG